MPSPPPASPRRVAVPVAKPAAAASSSSKPVAGTFKPAKPTAAAAGGRTGIREAGYRHWEGTYTGHTFRWWTIARATLRSTIYTKGRLFMLLLLGALAWIFPFFFGVFYFFGAFTSELQGAANDPDAFLRNNLYQMLEEWQWMWAVVFSAVIGSRLVSNDLRSEAFYIYLSKPIRRIDYFIGKVLACVVWTSVVTLLPALWVFMAANGATNEIIKLDDSGEIFWEIMGLQFLILLVCSSAAVCISSLTKRWALALIGWLGLPFIMLPIASITAFATRDPEWFYMSPIHNIWIVGQHMLEQEVDPVFTPAWEGALWTLIAMIVVSLGVFLLRVWKLEAAE